MLHRIISLLVLLSTCSTFAVQQSNSPPSLKEIVDRALMSDRSYHSSDKDLQEIIALGPQVVPEVRRHLDGNGYRRALYVLSQIPDVARDSIKEALQSQYTGHRLTALDLAEPFLVSGDQEMLNLWVDAFCSIMSSAYELPSRYAILLKVEPGLRAPATDRILQCVAANLTRYESVDSAKAMIYFLGQFGEPSDPVALDAVKTLRNNIDHQFKSRIFQLYPQLRITILDACEFALANLGDQQALDSFIKGMESGDARLWRIHQLPRMHARPELLHAVLGLLADETVIGQQGSAGRSPLRACDATMRALREWFPEFPGKVSLNYTPEELAEAKIWVAKRILELQEKQLQGDVKPTE